MRPSQELASRTINNAWDENAAGLGRERRKFDGVELKNP